jgi:tetratricopeptide (TPR) repeat protein
MIHHFSKAIRLLVGGGLLLVLLLSADRVRAQPPDASVSEDDEEYKDIVSQAVEEYESQHWAKAIELFQKAHAIKPNARTLRGMGLAAFEDSRYMEAVQWLTEALEHKEKPLTREMRADIKPVIARAREFVGFYELSNDPVNVTIEIDGRPALIDKDTVKVDVGERHLVAKAKGYETLEKTLHVISGDNGV